jgi:hypothetical protein
VIRARRRLARSEASRAEPEVAYAGVLALQRSAGNRAVTAMLARSSTPASPAPAAPVAPGVPCAALRVPPSKPGLDPANFGETEPHDVAVTIGAVQQGGAWVPEVTMIAGHYSIETRLMPNQQQVTGPSGNTTEENFRAQLDSLQARGKDGHGGAAPWYMIEAVEAHEHVHEQRLLPALEQTVPSILQDVAAISIPDDGTLDAAAAATALEADPRFQSALHEAYVSWIANVFDNVLNDHYGGPAEQAEQRIVDPMIAAIRAEAEARDWPGRYDTPNVPTRPRFPEPI